MSTSVHDDERIAAYLDGEMDEAAMAAFERELEARPDLRQTLEAWQGNDAFLRGAFAQAVDEVPDAALLARMGLCDTVGEPAHSGAANDNPAPAWRRYALPGGLAAAAALALAVLLRVPGDHRADDLAPLDRLAALEEADIGGGARLRPTLTVRTSDGRFCREFARIGGSAPGRGLACRSGGAWQMEAFAPGTLVEGQGPMPAAGPGDRKLEETYGRLGASDALDPAAERALIASRWAAD